MINYIACTCSTAEKCAFILKLTFSCRVSVSVGSFFMFFYAESVGWVIQSFHAWFFWVDSCITLEKSFISC